MEMENQIKQIENINQKKEKFNFIAVHKENLENNYSKPNSELSSKYATIENKIKDIFSDKEQLEFYIKKENPIFLEKFEILEIIKTGSVGSVVKSRYKLKGKKNSSDKLIALKFINNIKEKKQNHSEIIIHASLKCKNIPEIEIILA